LCGFASPHFFCARKNASHFSLSGAKKRQLQPERYATFGLKFCVNIKKKDIENNYTLLYNTIKE